MVTKYYIALAGIFLCSALLCEGKKIDWKINLGGPAVDGFLAEEEILAVGEDMAKMRYHGSIKGSGADLNVFKTQRFSRNEDLVLNIPVPDGVYTVTLYFAETWAGAYGSGKRVFDVYMGSKPGGIVKVCDAMDPFRSGGPAGAVRRKFDNIATQGGLTLALRPIKQNPQIAGVIISGYSYSDALLDDIPTAVGDQNEKEDFSLLGNVGPRSPLDASLIYDPSLNPKFKQNRQTPTPPANNFGLPPTRSNMFATAVASQPSLKTTSLLGHSTGAAAAPRLSTMQGGPPTTAFATHNSVVTPSADSSSRFAAPQSFYGGMGTSRMQVGTVPKDSQPFPPTAGLSDTLEDGSLRPGSTSHYNRKLAFTPPRPNPEDSDMATTLENLNSQNVQEHRRMISPRNEQLRRYDGHTFTERATPQSSLALPGNELSAPQREASDPPLGMGSMEQNALLTSPHDQSSASYTLPTRQDSFATRMSRSGYPQDDETPNIYQAQSGTSHAEPQSAEAFDSYKASSVRTVDSSFGADHSGDHNVVERRHQRVRQIDIPDPQAQPQHPALPATRPELTGMMDMPVVKHPGGTTNTNTYQSQDESHEQRGQSALSFMRPRDFPAFLHHIGNENTEAGIAASAGHQDPSTAAGNEIHLSSNEGPGTQQARATHSGPKYSGTREAVVRQLLAQNSAAEQRDSLLLTSRVQGATMGPQRSEPSAISDRGPNHSMLVGAPGGNLQKQGSPTGSASDFSQTSDETTELRSGDQSGVSHAERVMKLTDSGSHSAVHDSYKENGSTGLRSFGSHSQPLSTSGIRFEGTLSGTSGRSSDNLGTQDMQEEVRGLEEETDPPPAGVLNGNGMLEGICVDNSTHCSCGMVQEVSDSPEECLFVVDEHAEPMVCMRKPCNGKLICACAAGANTLCKRSVVTSILVPSSGRQNHVLKEANLVLCRREDLEHGVSVLMPII